MTLLFVIRDKTKAWLELRGAVHSDPVASFGQKVGSILDAYLTKFFRANILWKSNLLKMKTTILHTRTIFYDALYVGLGDIGKARERARKASAAVISTAARNLAEWSYEAVKKIMPEDAAPSTTSPATKILDIHTSQHLLLTNPPPTQNLQLLF